MVSTTDNQPLRITVGEVSDPLLSANAENQFVSTNANPSELSPVARWNDAALRAVTQSSLGPPPASRVYGILNTAIYDAWSAYDENAIGTQLEDELQRPQSENTDANKAEAVSFAAYRTLVDLLPEQQEFFDRLMDELGYDPNNTTTDVTTPAGIGNAVSQALTAFRQQDGANQLGDDPRGDGTPYSDTTGYQPVNQPGPLDDPLAEITDIERWTPEFVGVDQREPGTQQTFLVPQFGRVVPFSLDDGAELREEGTLADGSPILPGPQPFLAVDGATVDYQARTITLADGEVVPISQDIISDGDGPNRDIINRGFIDQITAPGQLLDISANLTDEQKLIAEFWEDGPGTSFPPGTFLAFTEFVSARDENTLDQDVEMYFKVGNAVFDAGITAWDAKEFFDYTRPIRAVRSLGALDLIGEFDPEVGDFVVEAYVSDSLGPEFIRPEDYDSYQTPGGDPSPAFAEYVSGHSTFSDAAARVLVDFTGSDVFGASTVVQPGESRFEPGFTPVEPTTIEWDTFTGAAFQSSRSRQFGAIHFEEGGRDGEALGMEVGDRVIEQSNFFLNPDEITGTFRRDDITGTDGNDIIRSRAGADTINAGDGNDIIKAGLGRDTVDGGAGRDIITGQFGDDVLTGGEDSDIFEFTKNHGDDIVTDFNPDEDFIRLRGGLTFAELIIEDVNGGATFTSNDPAFIGNLNVFLEGVSASELSQSDFIEVVV